MGTALASLEVTDLACVRGDRALFRNLFFKVEPGRALVVEGPNGSGKTSLLRMLAGFLSPATGSIALRIGPDQVVDAEDRGKHIGWFGHQDGLKPQLTAKENLSFFAQLYSSNADAGATLEWAGLSRAADFPVQYLSAGQKKRLALARLKLSERPVWLLDEPFAALDVAGKKLVEQMLADHCATGSVAVVATHEAISIPSAKLALSGAPR
ncbi:MAG TPA: heme ABC exporter ATP-binding protein CcmA [Rhizomicrobium sp.]|nr:heme ABC exporter ATP-binding protein CcmA [Rhizomicrobium sp.]